MSQQYQYGLFGCFGDFRMCIITFVAPCYTVGKNAEHFGEDCMIIGLLSCLGLPFSPVLRWRLRAEKNLEGSMLMDTVLFLFCGCCMILQDAREIGWGLPSSVANVGKKRGDQTQDMDRQ